MISAITAHPYVFACLGFIVYYAIRNAVNLLANIRYARSTGLPYFVYPFSQTNLFMKILWSFQWFQNLLDALPETWGDRLNDLDYATKWKVRNREVKRKGGVFLNVSPGMIWANIADAEVVMHITSKHKDFVKPIEAYVALATFGENVVTTEGKDWIHHRRHTAPAFNERNNALVWKESIQQALDMTKNWSTLGSPIPNLANDTMRLALHVISSAGFGVPMGFSTSKSTDLDDILTVATPPPGYTFNYPNAISFITFGIVGHMIVMLLLPHWIGKCFFPQHIAAHEDFSHYMRAIVTRAGRSDSRRTDNVLGIMTERVGQSAADAPTNSGKRQPTGLTTDELMGNIFVITLAGHETTAKTLHYAFLILALRPDLQAWLHTGLDRVLPANSEPEAWDYATIFPQLIEPLCILYETLRYFAIISSIPKHTGPHGGTLLVPGHGPVHLRPMYINLVTAALHHNTTYYGADPGNFVPQRWDARNITSHLARNGLMPENPGLHRAPKGAFLSFSDGVRGCMGKKFATVEFVAVLATVMRGRTVEIVKRKGETKERAEERVWRAVGKSTAIIALGLIDGGEVVVRFRDR